MNASAYVNARADALAGGNLRVLNDPRRVLWSELDAETQHHFNCYLHELLECLDHFFAHDSEYTAWATDRIRNAVSHYKMAIEAYGIRCFHPPAIQQRQTHPDLPYARWKCPVCGRTVEIHAS